MGLGFMGLGPELATVKDGTGVGGPEVRKELGGVPRQFSLFSQFIVLCFVFIYVFVPF